MITAMEKKRGKLKEKRKERKKQQRNFHTNLLKSDSR